MRLAVRAFFLSVSAVLATTSCGDVKALQPPPQGTQYIVGIDISGSIAPDRLEEGKDLLRDLIGRLKYGDRLVLIETRQVTGRSAKDHIDSIPPARDPVSPTPTEMKEASYIRQAAAASAVMYFDTTRSKAIRTTDLLGTLWRAADQAAARKGRPTVLLLLSDMLNATPDLNMEGASALPGREWISSRKAQHRLPDLTGVCVFAVGADVNSGRAVRVRRFWKELFAATGAVYEDSTHFRTMLPTAELLRCS
jgi:hypothetical protein